MEKNGNNITVFSAKEEKPVNPNQEDVTKQPQQEEPKKEEPKSKEEPKKPSEPEPKETEDLNKKEEPKAEPKKEDKKKVEDEPTFNVITKKTEEPKEKEPKEAEVQYTTQGVLDFLNKNGIKISSLSEISKKEELSDAVREFKSYNEKTGRGIAAFYNSKRDWSKEDKDTTIREYLKYTEPDLDEDGIESELQLLKISDDEKDDLTEREIKSTEQNYRRMYSKALSYMKNISKEFNTPSKDEQPQKPREFSDEEIAQRMQPYWDKRDKSLSDLNEVKLNLEGLDEISAPISKEHKNLIASITQTEQTFFQRWQDANGILNTDKVALDVAFSIPEIRNEIFSNMAKQIYTMLMNSESKKRRNVSIDDKRTVDTSKSDSKGVVTFGGKSSNREDSKFGQPLIPERN